VHASSLRRLILQLNCDPGQAQFRPNASPEFIAQTLALSPQLQIQLLLQPSSEEANFDDLDVCEHMGRVRPLQESLPPPRRVAPLASELKLADSMRVSFQAAMRGGSGSLAPFGERCLWTDKYQEEEEEEVTVQKTSARTNSPMNKRR
jgi:hypothetical protein